MAVKEWNPYEKPVTLSEYVFSLVTGGKAQSEEFKALASLYGLEHLRKIYREERERVAGYGK